MPEEINSEAAESVTDEMLDAAAAEVEDTAEVEDFQETPEEEVVEDVVDESELSAEPEVPEEPELPPEPTDNRERTKLGKKVEKLFQYKDQTDQKLDMVLETLKQLTTKPAEPEDPYDPDVIEKNRIRQEAKEVLREERLAERQVKEQYTTDYLTVLAEATEDMSDEEADAFYVEHDANFNVAHSNDGRKDALKNCLGTAKALIAKNNAKPIEKKNPIKGKKSETPIGTIKKQTVEKKSTPLPDLDNDAKAYLDWVKSTDGDEAAENLHKDLTKPARSYIRG